MDLSFFEMYVFLPNTISIAIRTYTQRVLEKVEQIPRFVAVPPKVLYLNRRKRYHKNPCKFIPFQKYTHQWRKKVRKKETTMLVQLIALSVFLLLSVSRISSFFLNIPQTRLLECVKHISTIHSSSISAFPHTQNSEKKKGDGKKVFS